MKTNISLVLSAAILVSIGVSGCGTAGITSSAGAKTTDVLFDGKGFDGWVAVLTDPAKTLGDVWKVQNGEIVCAGDPMGYLQSAGKFRDFELELEYCWPAGQTNGNSGIFIHVNGEPKALLPRAIECQLKPGRAGDLMGFHGMNLSGAADRLSVMPENPKAGKLTKLLRRDGNERPLGEWNKVKIRVKDGTVTAWFNGALVNEASGLESISGHIGLQSEGGTVSFRNIRAVRL